MPAVTQSDAEPLPARETSPATGPPLSLPTAPSAAGRACPPHTPADEPAAIYADRILLLAIGTLLSLACFGHFAKPHGDFFELYETGDALLRGDLPATFKRAPLFPLLVAGLARLLEWHGGLPRPAPVLAGELLNAALLPLNIVLTHCLTCLWVGPAGRWAALLFALLPVGLYCTAHTIVEPLMVSTLLATLLLAGRGGAGAYVPAALASLTRYDLAGLLVGLAWRDWRSGTRFGPILKRTALAAAPLTLWLGATAWTWPGRSRDHYLTQIVEAWRFDPLATLQLFARGVWNPGRIRLPVWCGEFEPALAAALGAALAMLAAIGFVRLMLRRAAGMDVALLAGGGYFLVHAAFPFDFARFAYPLTPLAIVAIVAGAAEAWRIGQRTLPGRLVRAALALPSAAAALVIAFGEGPALIDLLRARPDWPRSPACIAVCGTLALIVAAVPVRVLRWLSFALLLPLTLIQARVGVQTLGGGREMRPLIDAIRWVDAQRRGSEGCFSPVPGLARLYGQPGVRQLGPEDLHAAEWDALLTELLQREVRWIIWYDVFTEQGDYYVAKWRLDRFWPLEDPDTARGVLLAETFDTALVTVRVYRLRYGPGAP